MASNKSETTRAYPSGVIETVKTSQYAPKYAVEGSNTSISTNGIIMNLSGAQDESIIQNVAQSGKNQRLLIILGSLGILLGILMLALPNEIISNSSAFLVSGSSAALVGVGIVYKQIQFWFSIGCGVAIVIGIAYCVVKYFNKRMDS